MFEIQYNLNYNYYRKIKKQYKNKSRIFENFFIYYLYIIDTLSMNELITCNIL